MTNTRNPEALRWKNPAVDPIVTRAGIIVQFGGDPIPNQATVDGWEAEHDVFAAAEEAKKRPPPKGGTQTATAAHTKIDALIDALIANGTLER